MSSHGSQRVKGRERVRVGGGGMMEAEVRVMTSVLARRKGSTSQGVQVAPETGKGGRRILPWSPQKEGSLADTLILAQGDPVLTSDLQNSGNDWQR